MLIKVTAEDIKNGKRALTDCCPVALATSRLLGKVRVTPRYLYATNVMVLLPLVAVNFIYKFDRGEPVRPFTFELETRCHF